MANEVELGAVASKASAGVPIVARDALHLGLGHGAVVVVGAVGAAAAACFFLVHLHGFAERNPIGLVGRGFVAWDFWPEHPVVDHHLGVLFVLRCGDEFFAHWKACEALGDDHEFVHFGVPLGCDFAARGADGK